MSTSARPKQIDELMEKASQALADTEYFKAEAFAAEALTKARQRLDFDRMARIVLPLLEARRQRYQRAIDVGTIEIVDDLVAVREHWEPKPGCFLVQPPVVGADARRMRLHALQAEVPVAIICREPTTQIGLCPIVAIAPGVTVRTHTDLPDDEAAPDMAWFVETMEVLGDFAIEALDPELAILKRVDALIGRLDAVPEHEGLHQALEAVCHEAAQELEAEGA